LKTRQVSAITDLNHSLFTICITNSAGPVTQEAFGHLLLLGYSINIT